MDAGPADPAALVQRGALRAPGPAGDPARSRRSRSRSSWRTFKGLTSSTKRSEVAAAAGLSYQPLAALLDDSGTALDLMRTPPCWSPCRTRAGRPSPPCSGAVGKEAFEALGAEP